MQRLSASVSPPAVSAIDPVDRLPRARRQPVEVAQDPHRHALARAGCRAPARCTPRAGSSARRSRPAGRCQFSWLKANRREHPDARRRGSPRSPRAPRVIPAWWPSGRGSDRPLAQRPLPSMMMAMWAGTAPCTFTCCSRSSLIRQTSMISASLAWIRPSICLMCSSVIFWTSFSARVLSSSGTFSSFLILRHRLGAGVAHRDAAFLGQLVDHLHQILAPLLRQRRQRHPDQVALGGRVEAEIGVADGLLDGLGERLVERLDREEAGFGRRHHGDLVERHRAAVGLDPHECRAARCWPCRSGCR